MKRGRRLSLIYITGIAMSQLVSSTAVDNGVSFQGVFLELSFTVFGVGVDFVAIVQHWYSAILIDMWCE